MRRGLIGVIGLAWVAACTQPASQSNHQNLNVKDCQAIADAVLRSGKTSNNLCPGYMPDGQAVEIP